MTNVILSFDTEDIINERGADGIFRCARILREEGVKGCFNIIGLLPDVLKDWGRNDIFEELKWHEIDYHSHSHSIHPTINEYTDIEDYRNALELFMLDEGKGLEKVKSAFNINKLPAACIPGNCTSYVAHYGYGNMGFDFFSGDDIYDKISYRPIYNCNTVSLHYARSLDGVLFKLNNESEIKNFINETARGKHTMVFYHHPQRAYCKTFWDADNFYKKNTSKENWIMSEIHDQNDTERFYANFRSFVRALRDDGDFKIMTYADLTAEIREDERKLNADSLKCINEQLNEKFFPVTSPDSYCISDIFLACRSILLGNTEHVCGKVYGFLYEPYLAKEPITLTRAEATELAKAIDPEAFLPNVFRINRKIFGPRELLEAFLAFVLDGKDKYTVYPLDEWQIDLDEFPSLRDLNYKGSWVHSDELCDNYLSSRLRLQSWTIRLPKNSKRTIF